MGNRIDRGKRFIAGKAGLCRRGDRSLERTDRKRRINMLGKRVLVVLNIDENAKASHKLDDVALQRDTRKQEALREA